MRPVTPPEFSRCVRIDDLPPLGRSVVAAANATEREALARRFGLARLMRLEVEGEVTAIRGGTVIRLAARLSADVTQTCVVTLVPLERRIEADFVRLYAADAAGETRLGEEIFFDEEDEDIEPPTGNRIDAGEAAAEQLALELDPYPRAPGAALAPAPAAGSSGEEGEDARCRPFADLAGRAKQAPARKQSK
jgi:Large ribosomal RNA subunit accumulation protein YceD